MNNLESIPGGKLSTEKMVEQQLLRFAKEGPLYILKNYWKIILGIHLLLSIGALLIINTFPKRYQVKAIVKTGVLGESKESLSMGAIMGGLGGTGAKSVDPEFKNTFGLNSKDLLLILKLKYGVAKSGGFFSNMYWSDARITSINLPKKSSLITLVAEGENQVEAQVLLEKVISDLYDRFQARKKIILKQSNKRLGMIKADLINVQEKINLLRAVENEYGYNEKIASKKEIHLTRETNLRHLVLDMELQVSPERMDDFKLISVKFSSFPVSTRSLVYFLVGQVCIFILILNLIFIASIVRFIKLPPMVEGFAARKENDIKFPKIVNY